MNGLRFRSEDGQRLLCGGNLTIISSSCSEAENANWMLCLESHSSNHNGCLAYYKTLDAAIKQLDDIQEYIEAILTNRVQEYTGAETDPLASITFTIYFSPIYDLRVRKVKEDVESEKEVRQ